MIIEEYDETKKVVLNTIWKFKDSDQEYSTTWSVCKSPFCGCSILTFGIGIYKNMHPMASFKYDVEKKTFEEIGTDNADKILSKKLISELTSEDQEILYRIFRSEKEIITTNVNNDEIEPPDFLVDEIENRSLMVNYMGIFPWAKDHWFVLDDITYFVFDQYCLNSACNCKNVDLRFSGYLKNGHQNAKDPLIISISYDSKKWQITEKGNQAHSPSSLMIQLEMKYPDIRQLLHKRRNQLKLLFKRYKELHGYTLYPQTITQTKTPGRNDPCPCGSGKKYKTCCLKN